MAGGFACSQLLAAGDGATKRRDIDAARRTQRLDFKNEICSNFAIAVGVCSLRAFIWLVPKFSLRLDTKRAIWLK